MSSSLPSKPNLEYLKKQAKDLLKSYRSGDLRVCDSLREHLPRFARKSAEQILGAKLSLHDAQHAIAREYGFENWSDLRRKVATAAGQRVASHSPRMDRLGEKMRCHIDALGFATVGGYRIWCHRQRLDSGLDKSDEQLQRERERARTPGSTRPPAPARGHRRGQAEWITRIYERESGENAPRGWLVDLFEATADEEERTALYRLLIHLEKYARVDLYLASPLARHHRDWLRPVEEWFPQGARRDWQLAELTRFLLGREELPPSADSDSLRGIGPLQRHREARVRHDGKTVLTPEDVAAFEERGYVRVPRAFPRETALEIQEFMWSELERLHRFKKDDPSTWTLEGWKPSRWTRLKLNDNRDHEVYRRVASPRLMGAIEELIGAEAASWKQSWGAFTIAFPEAAGTPWELGHRWTMWPHPRPNLNGLLGAATFYSRVAPRGGGTLVVEGSHRLVMSFFDRLKPSERTLKVTAIQNRFFRSHPWFAELAGKTADRGDRIRRFMEEETLIDGVPVRLVELTGEPGDAVLYHATLVRGPSLNLSDRPKFTRG